MKKQAPGIRIENGDRFSLKGTPSKGVMHSKFYLKDQRNEFRQSGFYES
jgi:hypothetical protein